MNVFSKVAMTASKAFDRIHCDDLVIGGAPARGVLTRDPEAVLGFGTQLLNGAVLALEESSDTPLAVNTQVTHAGIDYVVVEPDRSRDSFGWRKYLVSRR